MTLPTPSRSVAAGAAAFALAAGLAAVDLRLAVPPLALFVLACFTAPAFPSWSFFLRIDNRGRRESRQVALTFDDGPDPATTPALLDLLERERVSATFFVIGERALSHPVLMRRILAAGHEVGNHTLHHDVLLMLRPVARLRAEVEGGQRALESFGVETLVFRPPAGVTSPRLGGVLAELGLCCVGFSVRARDFGNRRIGKLARRIIGGAKGGDIVLLHDCAPPGLEVHRWLGEVEKIIGGLRARSLAMVPLSQLRGRPTQRSVSPRAPAA
jgi:peptidoglycan/xylan/chitin deacetylase (PgdA/CDA1 family)